VILSIITSPKCQCAAIGAPLVLTLYLQWILRYWGSNVSGSRSWPL